jgi:four helix bundle protein
MNSAELRTRTKAFALRVVQAFRRLPRSEEARVIGRQLLRAGTGVGANYRAVCRPRSDADFIAKLGIAIEECDEAAFWLEVLIDSGIVSGRVVGPLLREADELTRIFVASRETVRRRLRSRRAKSR